MDDSRPENRGLPPARTHRSACRLRSRLIVARFAFARREERPSPAALADLVATFEPAVLVQRPLAERGIELATWIEETETDLVLSRRTASKYGTFRFDHDDKWWVMQGDLGEVAGWMNAVFERVALPLDGPCPLAALTFSVEVD